LLIFEFSPSAHIVYTALKKLLWQPGTFSVAVSGSRLVGGAENARLENARLENARTD